MRAFICAVWKTLGHGFDQREKSTIVAADLGYKICDRKLYKI